MLGVLFFRTVQYLSSICPTSVQRSVRVPALSGSRTPRDAHRHPERYAPGAGAWTWWRGVGSGWMSWSVMRLRGMGRPGAFRAGRWYGDWGARTTARRRPSRAQWNAGFPRTLQISKSRPSQQPQHADPNLTTPTRCARRILPVLLPLLRPTWLAVAAARSAARASEHDRARDRYVFVGTDAAPGLCRLASS